MKKTLSSEKVKRRMRRTMTRYKSLVIQSVFSVSCHCSHSCQLVTNEDINPINLETAVKEGWPFCQCDREWGAAVAWQSFWHVRGREVHHKDWQPLPQCTVGGQRGDAVGGRPALYYQLGLEWRGNINWQFLVIQSALSVECPYSVCPPSLPILTVPRWRWWVVTNLINLETRVNER